MNKFEITSIRVHKLPENQNSNVVGMASIVINHSFLINDIRIIKTKEKMFCGMPSRKLEDQSFVDICHPLDEKTRKYLENSILAEFINCKEEVKDDE